MKQLLASFNGGEVTPLLEGRTDLVSLQKSCRLLRNFIPTSAGAAVRRPSLLHKDALDAEGATGAARLIPFVYDTETRYVLAVTDSLVIYRFDQDGVLAETIDVTGLAGDLFPNVGTIDPFKITHAQVGRVLFFASPEFPPFLWDAENGIRTIYSGSGLGKNYWPAVLDESVTSLEGGDAVEGWTIQKAIAATGSFVVGGAYNSTMAAAMNSGPCPAFWRLYTGTTAFVGTIKIEAADTYNASTWRLLYTVTNASTGAMTLRQEWYHTAPFLRITVTRTSGTATMELRHVGSTAAPSVWYNYQSASSNPYELHSSPSGFADFGLGEHIQLSAMRIKQQVDVTVSATADGSGAGGTDEYKTSDEIFIQGKWELYTTGIWDGDVYLEAKESTGSWRTVRHLQSKRDQNYSIAGESDGETMRVRVVKYIGIKSSSVVGDPRFSLRAVDGLAKQWFTVTDTGTTTIKIDGMSGFDEAQAAQATTGVSRGAFSGSQGHPASVCIHDQRVYFGGTTKRPTTIWASSVNDLFNFRRTGFDDGGFMFELAANEGNPIQWMTSASRGILLGTSGDEWLLDGAETGITPTNITARRQSRIGSASIQAIPAAGSTIFVQRGAMHLMEYQFAWESQQFQAVDLTELVKHLTPSGIRSIAFSQNPEPTLWCVMLDGSLLSCTYNRAQEVIAWAKHTTSGTFESVATTYGETANADDVWFIVLRDSVRYLEKMDADFWANLYNGGRLHHVDAGYVKTGAAFTTVTGLSWLNGKTVKIIANGVAQADAVVSSGTVAVPSGTTHAVVGLGFDSELQPMPFDIPLQTGTAQGRKVHTPALAVRLYRSDAAKYADQAAATLYDMKISANTTGLVRLATVGRMNDSLECYFKSVGALPLNFVTVIPSVNVYGE